MLRTLIWINIEWEYSNIGIIDKWLNTKRIWRIIKVGIGEGKHFENVERIIECIIVGKI